MPAGEEPAPRSDRARITFGQPEEPRGIIERGRELEGLQHVVRYAFRQRAASRDRLYELNVLIGDYASFHEPIACPVEDDVSITILLSPVMNRISGQRIENYSHSLIIFKYSTGSTGDLACGTEEENGVPTGASCFTHLAFASAA